MSCTTDSTLTVPKGTLTGFITLFDEFGFPIEDRSEVTVYLIAGGSEKTSVTDPQGKFTIPDVPPGSYDLRFEKNNFGTQKLFGVQFTAGTQPLVISNVSLHQLTTTNILSFDTSLEELPFAVGYQITVSIALDPFANKRRSFIVFVNTVNSVSDKNYKFYKKLSIVKSSGLFQEPLFDDEFISQFNSGTVLYLTAYPLATGEEGYFDPNFGLNIFSTTGNQTDVKSIVVP